MSEEKNVFREAAIEAISDMAQHLPLDCELLVVACRPGKKDFDLVLPSPESNLNNAIDALRRNGLSIDGDNAYKRDLLDCVVGALATGAQNSNPPPAGHWGQRFWDIGREERASSEQLLKALTALTQVAGECEQIASNYSGTIDGIFEHGGDDHEDPSCAIFHRLYYAMFYARAAIKKPPTNPPSAAQRGQDTPCQQPNSKTTASPATKSPKPKWPKSSAPPLPPCVQSALAIKSLSASGTSKAAGFCTASGDTTNGSKANGSARRNGPPPRIDPHPLYVERQPAQ